MGVKHLKLGVKANALQRVLSGNLNVHVVHVRIGRPPRGVPRIVDHGRAVAVALSLAPSVVFHAVYAWPATGHDRKLVRENLFLKGVVVR
jgi:hypothetical protein